MDRDYKRGQRVELHPGTDRWMRGDRFGTTEGRHRSRNDPDLWIYYVKMDRSGQTIKVAEENIGKWL